MKQPGQVLREYRESKGLSCKEFAKKLKWPEVTLRSRENGNRPITAEIAVDVETKTQGDLTRDEILPKMFRGEKTAA